MRSVCVCVGSIMDRYWLELAGSIFPSFFPLFCHDLHAQMWTRCVVIIRQIRFEVGDQPPGVSGHVRGGKILSSYHHHHHRRIVQTGHTHSEKCLFNDDERDREGENLTPGSIAISRTKDSKSNNRFVKGTTQTLLERNETNVENIKFFFKKRNWYIESFIFERPYFIIIWNPLQPYGRDKFCPLKKMPILMCDKIKVAQVSRLN